MLLCTFYWLLNLRIKTNSADVDECLTNNAGCHQECINNLGSYTCNCAVGYYLGEDGHQCHGKSCCWQRDKECLLCGGIKLPRLVHVHRPTVYMVKWMAEHWQKKVLAYLLYIHVCCSCTYMYMHVHTCTCMYMYVCTFVHVHVRTCTCMYTIEQEILAV